MARRDFGSIRQLPSRRDTKKRKYGRWQGRYTGPDGSTVTAPSTFATRSEAEGWLAAERRLIDTGQWAPVPARLAALEEEARRSATLGAWMDQWLESHRPHLRESTAQSYERDVANRITGAHLPDEVARLARTPLDAVTATELAQWWDAVSTHFTTPPTNRRAAIRIKAALAEAQARGLIPAAPPMPAAAGRRVPAKDKELPQTWELWAIVEQMNPRYRLLTSLCLFLGLRVGEAMALKREHVVNRGTATSPVWVVLVRGNLQRVTGEDGRVVLSLQPPKTTAGTRDVPVMAALNDIVAAHLADYSHDDPGSYLTTTPTGQPVMDTSLRTQLKRARERAGVSKPISFHYGRNWVNTYLAEQGATPAEIGALLGEKDLATITETYMKVRPARLGDMMGALGEFAQRSAPGSG